MKLRNRFILVFIGVIIFIILTPVLVLFARGFKYDFETNQIVKTGTMVVKTMPEKANVFLNDEMHKDRTPSTLRFLLPDDYVVRIEKNGYQSWTKRLSVRSQLVTWANLSRDYIYLFLDNPKSQSSISASQISVSDNQKQIAYLSGSDINFIETNSSQTNPLVKLKINDVAALQNKIIWSDAQKTLNLLLNLKLDVSTINFLLNAERVQSNDSKLYALSNASLYELDNKPRIVAKNVTGFYLSADEVWYISNNRLVRQNLNSGNAIIAATDLPLHQTAQIFKGNGHVFLNINNTLYALNQTFDKIYSPVTKFNFSHDFKAAVYGNDFEIFAYDPATTKSELILRSTTDIQDLAINTRIGYVFFQNENKIKAIELDGRDHRNVYDLTPSLEKFVISEDGDKLYLYNNEKLEYYILR